VVLRDSKRPRQSKEHVKGQVSLWCELVGFRIRRTPQQQLLKKISRHQGSDDRRLTSLRKPARPALRRALSRHEHP
jgi:hypothetical protein